MSKTHSTASESFWKGFWPSMAILVVVLSFLFRDSFKDGFAHFSNDGPLGVMKSEALQVPASFTGYWPDLNWLGSNGAAAPVSFSYLLLWLLGPVGFAKFYPPITLLLLGASAWIFFRTLRLSPGLCCVAALAAALNMNFFSNTCWGLGTRSLTLMSAFLALAALNTRRAGNPWVNAALAGLCVGLGVVEGADNGAIFSLFIAAYVVFQAFAEEATWRRRIVSALRLGVVGLFAAFLAAQVLVTLTGIAAKTARGAKTAPGTTAAAPLTPEQREAEDQKQWVFATQWSLPPKEQLLRTIIPGIHGYRMDTPGGGQYWGRVGEYWAMEDGPQRRASRSSGAGEYAGILVVLIGFWAVFHAWSRGPAQKPIFEQRERRFILFWAAMLIPSVLFSWGYHAPFYKLVYALPYFSTIRNPMKFMHPGHMILIILFGYGLIGLSRRYLEGALVKAASFGERFRNWRAKALPVEKWWFRISIALVVIGIFAFLARSSGQAGLVRHLQEIGFPNESDARDIARFSTREVGWFALFLLGSAGLVTLIQLGAFAGHRAKAAVILLGILVTLDLGRADVPWIKHYDYREQYASNPIIDVLREKPWEHRAAVVPFNVLMNPQTGQADPLFAQWQQPIGIINQIWRGPWLQWLCQYYNIQSLDMAQDPRPPAEKTNYISRLPLIRLWELTNTRYLLGAAGGFDNALNQRLDPAQRRFRQVTSFALKQNSENNVGADINPTAPWALIEFTGALPRAKLYSQWLVTNYSDAALEMLANPAFDPHATVLVHETIPAPQATNAAPGTVEFTSYAPKHIELKATATAPSLLLLNDQYDPAWSVTVNGKPTPLLRCNYLMRGVQVPAGASTVVFDFQPSLTGMRITLVAFALGIGLCVFLAVSKRRFPEPERVS